MKECRISLRVSVRRMNKFRDYAVNQDKTLTQLIEDYIDSLPSTKIAHSDAGVPATAPLSSTNIPD
ncbi:hypothetical protein F8S20_19915 [Nostoc sp. BAE]|nr:hypothetical protein [Nostoc commune BAE]